VRRERQETRLLLHERLGDGARGIPGHLPGVRHRVAPRDELPVEIRDIAEVARGEERLAQVANRALDAAFFPGRSHGAGPGDEVVVAAELEEPWVEADRLPLPLEDGAFHVVVEQDPRHPVQRAEGLDMPAQKTLEGLIQHEDGMQRPRPAQHQDEGGEPPGSAPDGDRAEAPPIGLALLPGEEVQSEIGGGLRRGPEQPHGVAHLAHAARVAPRPHHLEEPRGAEPRVLRQGRLEEGAIRVERARPDGRGPGEALRRQRAPDGVGVERELRGDGPHPPVLGEEETADLDDLRGRDHGSPPPPGRAPRARPPRPAGRRLLLPADETAGAATAAAAGRGGCDGQYERGNWKKAPGF